MIWAPCEKACAEKNQYVCRGQDRAFELVSEAPGLYFAKCGNCDHEQHFLEEEWQDYGKEMDRRAARTQRAGLTRYPRVEPHTGAVVNSRDDEVRAMKAYGMHAAPNGINEAYNDETAEKIKADRLSREAKKRERDKKRKALGRVRGSTQPVKMGKSAAHR